MPTIRLPLSASNRATRRMDVSAAIRVARLRAGLSVEEAAERLQCDRTTIWRWEAGQMRVSEDTILRMARVYDDRTLLLVWLESNPVYQALAGAA